jgi:hypothetical protein
MELNLETIEKLDRQALIQLINGWITQDFKKLLLVLYRLDVSEKKLSQLLAENKGIDAANIIATLIIERIAAAKLLGKSTKWTHLAFQKTKNGNNDKILIFRQNDNRIILLKFNSFAFIRVHLNSKCFIDIR